MFSFFKREKNKVKEKTISFDIELTATILAYEIARADGEILESELLILKEEIKKISAKVNKNKDEIFKIVENFSKNSVSFHEFIEDINKNYSKEEKHELIRFLWKVAYADLILEVNEEKLIRRIGDLIHIKDIEVLRIKSEIKEKVLNNLYILN